MWVVSRTSAARSCPKPPPTIRVSIGPRVRSSRPCAAPSYPTNTMRRRYPSPPPRFIRFSDMARVGAAASRQRARPEDDCFRAVPGADGGGSRRSAPSAVRAAGRGPVLRDDGGGRVPGAGRHGHPRVAGRGPHVRRGAVAVRGGGARRAGRNDACPGRSAAGGVRACGGVDGGGGGVGVHGLADPRRGRSADGPGGDDALGRSWRRCASSTPCRSSAAGWTTAGY